MPRTDVEFASLIAATDVDVLPDTSIVEDHGDHVVVRTPTNPSYHWGNFVHFRHAPAAGDRERWEAVFDDAFGAARESQHRSISWDAEDDGAAESEFLAVGYDPDRAVALVAEPHELVRHARANDAVAVITLDPDGDAELWDAVTELQVEAREPGHTEQEYRTFVSQRMEDRRARFRAGDGAWVVAQLDDGTVAASCGIVVTHGRCRFQAVDTALAHRRQGIATRLVHDAGQLAVDRFGAERLVIVAEVDYHARGMYESLGFVERERSLAVCWWPGAPNAAQHPRLGGLARPVD